MGHMTMTPPLECTKWAGLPVRLVPLDPGPDAEPLHAAFGDPEAMRHWHVPPMRDLRETRHQLEQFLAPDGAEHWAIQTDGVTVGTVGLLGDGDPVGVQWVVVPEWQGRGVAGAAAAAAIEYALGDGGRDRVEAWVNVTNTASLGVAHRAGLRTRGRLATRHPHEDAPHEIIVLGRERADVPPSPVLTVAPTLVVADPSSSAAILTAVFGGTIQALVGDPADLVILGLDPWSGSSRIQLRRRAREAPPVPVELTLDVSRGVDGLTARARAHGLVVEQDPADKPWYRRESTVVLADGHYITVSGPL